MINRLEQLDSVTRRLSNGLEVARESIEESDDEISFEFTFATPVELSSLSELQDPNSQNGIIFQRLVQKGWVSQDKKILRFIRREILGYEENRRIKFRFYLNYPTGTKVN
jgi:hypothetical protein